MTTPTRREWAWESGSGDSVKVGYENPHGQRCCGHRGVLGTDHLQCAPQRPGRGAPSRRPEPTVFEEVLGRALELERAPEEPDRRAAVVDELARLEREIARFTEAVAQGGSLPSILTALQAREQRRRELQAQLEHQEGLGLAARAFDSKAVRRELHELLTDWQGLLEGEPAQARQILRKLLEGRVAMQPRVDSGGRFYDWSVNATYGRLLAGVVGVTVMVPRGDSNNLGASPCPSLFVAG